MITWKLWSALYHPPLHHPLFLHVARARHTVQRWHWMLIGSCILVLSYLGYQLSFQQSRVYIILFALTLQDVIVLFVAFNLFYGCILVAGISRTISTMRHQRIYDVLCLIPDGASGVTWTMGVAAIYQGRGFRWFRMVIMLLAAIPLIALAIHFIIPLFVWGSSLITGTTSTILADSYHQMVFDLTYALTLIAAFYIGCVQSVVLSVLIGMLTPVSFRQMGTPLWSMGIFLLVQVLSLVLTLLFMLLFLPALYDRFQLSGWWVELGTPLWRLALFVALREAINLWFWRALRRRWYGDVTYP